MTTDIDFTPAATAKNLQPLSDALDDLDARIRVADVPEGPRFAHNAASLAAGRVWNLTCPAGNFDLSFVPSGTDGYDDLAVNAIPVAIADRVMPVADLHDVLRSKVAAARPKDYIAIPAIEARIAEQGPAVTDED